MTTAKSPTPKGPQRDLTSGPVVATLFFFALPALGVNILQSINGSVNAIWVGRLLGEGALAATSNAGMVMFLMIASLFGFATATTILIGQSMGRRDIDHVRKVVGGAVGLFLLAGLATALFGWIFTPQLLAMLSTPPEAFPLAVAYLRVVFISMPTLFVMILLTSALRGVGDAVTPFWSTVLNVVLDVILNPVLILGIGPFPKLGIAGSGLAMLIASLASTGFLIWQVYAKDLTIRLRGSELAYLRPSWGITSSISRLGLPMGLSMIILSLSGVVMIGLINREGVNLAAAFGVMSQLWNYVMMPGVAVGIAVSAMVAQNIGANRWDRVNRVAWAGIGINIIMQFLLIALVTIFIRPLLSLFLTEGSAAIPLSIHMNYMIGWTYAAMGVSMITMSVVRANGAVIAPLIFLIISMIFVRIGIGFGLHPKYGADAIWWAFGVSTVAAVAMGMGYFLHGGWRKLKPNRPAIT
jgi:putative MATE family efflux protein